MWKFFIPIIIFLTDRFFKLISPYINIGDDFVIIALYKNYAGAFSLPIAGIFYNILGVVFIFLFFYFFIFNFKKNKNFQSFAYLLIILGGASNMFDRLYFGYVIDYVQIINRSFFNLADVMLIMGVGIASLASMPSLLARVLIQI